MTEIGRPSGPSLHFEADCSHTAGVFEKFDGGRRAVLCEECRTIVAYGGSSDADSLNRQLTRLRKAMERVADELDEWDGDASPSLGGVSPGGLVRHAIQEVEEQNAQAE